jgi:hypothetical protein
MTLACPVCGTPLWRRSRGHPASKTHVHYHCTKCGLRMNITTATLTRAIELRAADHREKP